jgi:hypothetical protein
MMMFAKAVDIPNDNPNPRKILLFRNFYIACVTPCMSGLRTSGDDGWRGCKCAAVVASAMANAGVTAVASELESDSQACQRRNRLKID